MKQLFLICMSLFLIAGCSKDNNSNDNSEPINIALTKAEENIAQNEINFSLKLLHALANDEDIYKSNTNFFVSPYSVNAVLSVLATGATDKTAGKIYELLGYDKNDMESANSYYSLMNKSLSATDPNSTLALANSMWYNTNNIKCDINPIFESASKRFYNLHIAGEDFYKDNSSAKDNINKWCEKSTNGLIKGFLTDLNVSTKLLLLNSVYFNSKWGTGIGFKDTTSVFHSHNGNTKSIRMLTAESALISIMYISNLSCVKIPFGNGAFSFIAIMPINNDSFDNIICNLKDNIGYAKLNKYFANAESNWESVSKVVMPEIDITSNIDLSKAIESLGAKEIMENVEWNFFKESMNLQVNRFLQKSKISLNKDGVKAAAVTEADLWDGDALLPQMKDKIVLDHPYIFFISENSTNTILFSGIVREF